MSKKSEVLKSEVRAKVGTRSARALRAEGRIPASVGADDKHKHLDIHIEEHNFLATRRRHTHLYELDIQGDVQMAVVRELQWDVFGERIVHIDFKRVQRDVKTETVIELEFVGVPKGGILNHLVTHVTVSCIPMLIPDSIEIEVAKMELGHAFYARDLKLPEGVEYVGNKDSKIAVVVAAKVEVAPAAAAEGAAAAPAAAPAAEAPKKG